MSQLLLAELLPLFELTPTIKTFGFEGLLLDAQEMMVAISLGEISGNEYSMHSLMVQNKGMSMYRWTACFLASAINSASSLSLTSSDIRLSTSCEPN